MNESEMKNGLSACKFGGIPWEWWVFAGAVVSAWFLRNSFGMGWDDPQHAIYGSYVLDYFLSGFSDAHWRTGMGTLYYYGPLFDLLSAAIHRAGAWDIFLLRSWLMAIFGALAIPAVAAIGRRWDGERAAVFSVMALLLMPQFVGQSFINCKDIPFATGVAWSVLAVLRLLHSPHPMRFIACGAAFGLTMSVRAGGAVVFVFLTAGLGYLMLRSLRSKSLREDLRKLPGQWLFWGGLIPLIAWSILLLIWPFARENPISGPLEAFRQSSAFPTAYPVLFGGEVYLSNQLPVVYAPVMLFLTTPLVLVGFVGCGSYFALKDVIFRWKEERGLAAFVVGFWFLFPIGYVVATHPNIYDGIRHLLFVLPACALLAGKAAARISRGHRWGWPITATAMALCLPAIILSHPYEYTFYNVFAGPKGTLHERYETDYWLTSYRRAAEILNQGNYSGRLT